MHFRAMDLNMNCYFRPTTDPNQETLKHPTKVSTYFTCHQTNLLVMLFGFFNYYVILTSFLEWNI